ISQKNNQEKLPKDREDIKSINGIFFWKLIAGYHVPCITRIINGEELKFVSVRMAETQLLKNYIPYLHSDIYACTSVKSHFITDSEANLLNEINIKHCDGIYGKDTFYAGKDYIVPLEDVVEFYTFIEVCYNKVLSNITPGRIEKCGFIRINFEYVVPYCLKDGRKYLPLFYFEGETESQRQRAIKLEDWNLAYIKFCCKVQDIKNELYTFDSCTATTLDDIKNNFFPPDTHFEEYWPAKVFNKNLLINQKSPHVHPSGVWIIAPPEVLAPESTIPHSLTASAPGPPMSKGNCLMNGKSHVISSLPLVRVNNTEPVIGMFIDFCYRKLLMPFENRKLFVFYQIREEAKIIKIVTKCKIEKPRKLKKKNYFKIPNTSRDINWFTIKESPCINNSQDQQQQVQQHQPQQQQIITTSQVQPYSDPTSVRGRLTNTQQHNALRNVTPVVINRLLKSLTYHLRHLDLLLHLYKMLLFALMLALNLNKSLNGWWHNT
ncbi:Uncharacterized protein FWK35_00023367, partial [Aphis craccivora]